MPPSARSDQSGGHEPACDVLIVEDDAMLARELADFLSRTGLTVRTLPAGSQAVHHAATLKPRIALIDFNLPDLDGSRVAERISRLSPSTGMILMSGRIEQPKTTDLMELGVYTFLAKPVSLSQLRSAVRKVLQEISARGTPPVASPKPAGFFRSLFNG
jgi:DNA-binding response OmpR family regulator